MLGEVEVIVVAAGGKVIDPLPTASANSACTAATSKRDVADEDPQSVGILVRYGTFDFVDLGDLTWGVEHQLACPMNRIGAVDLFQTSQHGEDDSNAPQLVHGLAPLVAVMNNGASKGGSAATFEVIQKSPGLVDLWSLHQVNGNDAAHNASPATTANVGRTDTGKALRADVDASGRFTVTNLRTGEARTYQAR
jgi:hypothetical protein